MVSDFIKEYIETTLWSNELDDFSIDDIPDSELEKIEEYAKYNNGGPLRKLWIVAIMAILILCVFSLLLTVYIEIVG